MNGTPGQQTRPGQSPQQPSQPSIWQNVLFIVLVWMTVAYLVQLFSPPNRLELSYSAFKEKLAGGAVAEVTVKGSTITGRFAKPQAAPGHQGEKNASRYEKFKTVMPSFGDPALIDLLEKEHVEINAKTTETSWFMAVLINLLPWLLFIAFFIYTGRKMRERLGGGDGGGLFGFGKSKARLFRKTSQNETFADVAGLDNAKKELEEVVDFLRHPEKYQALGGTLPKGILLIGPPGTGKTLMARATAGEAGVPFFSLSGSEFIEMFVGVGASRVRDLFEKAKKESPAIIFIDEIDAIGRVRGTGLGGGHDEREQTLNQILSEMDGFEANESVVMLATTNRPDVLDPALVRPGRFDRRITLDVPHKKAREQILRLHTKEMPLADDVDLAAVAARSVGFSGADLRNLVNEAALMAARRDSKEVAAEDFDRGRDKILMGVESEELLNEEEKRGVAFHEAGHALLTRLLPGADPLGKVSIIPHGRALGVTEQIPAEDRLNLRQSYLLNRIAIMLGGRAAENIVFGEVSSGAADDLKKATQLARRMVCQWGMSAEIGPVAFSIGEPHPFLGRDIAEQKDFSEETGRLIDQEVQRITRQMAEKAEKLLADHRDALDRLAQGLIEHETLDRDKVDELLELASP